MKKMLSGQSHENEIKLRSYFWAAAIITAIVTIIMIILSTSKQLQEQKEESLKRELSRVLRTSEGLLKIWKRDLGMHQSMVASLPPVKKLVETGKVTSETKDVLDILRPWSNVRNFKGYALVKAGPGNKYSFIVQQEEIKRNFFERSRETILEALNGKFTISRPLYYSEDEVISVSATPVRNATGEIIGVLAFEINLRNKFSEISNLGKMGQSGETYIFNDQGDMITKSRFRDDPHSVSLKGHPFFKDMQKQTETKKYYYNVKGYRDYRGVKVIGAWAWDKDLNIGLITEIDSAEAYVSANIIRRAVCIMIIVVILLMTLIFIMREIIIRFRFKVMDQKEQTRKELLSIVSHDLKNPLNTLYVANQLLLKSMPEGDPIFKKQRDLLEKSFRAADRMKRLISDLLDTSRIEAGKLEINLTKCDPEIILKQTHDQHEALANSKDINFELKIPARLPLILADYDRLLQIFSNIIGNAIKYTPNGGKIELAAVEKEDCVRFSVKDNGPGISEDDQEHLFEAYWRSKNNKADFSTGLGLNIAKDFVTALGGSIWVESQLGKGSTFYFSIPIATTNSPS
jgi:signal transduction histidine kinase